MNSIDCLMLSVTMYVTPLDSQHQGKQVDDDSRTAVSRYTRKQQNTNTSFKVRTIECAHRKDRVAAGATHLIDERLELRQQRANDWKESLEPTAHDPDSQQNNQCAESMSIETDVPVIKKKECRCGHKITSECVRT